MTRITYEHIARDVKEENENKNLFSYSGDHCIGKVFLLFCFFCHHHLRVGIF